MARKIHRLTVKSAEAITKIGRHADGGGLYLSISKNGGRRWTFLYRWGGKTGKTIQLGFGAAPKAGVATVHVTLADARKLAEAARAKIAMGVNPKDDRKAAAVGVTFGEYAKRFINALEKHRVLMEAWATFCSTPKASKVVQFSGKQMTR